MSNYNSWNPRESVCQICQISLEGGIKGPAEVSRDRREQEAERLADREENPDNISIPEEIPTWHRFWLREAIWPGGNSAQPEENQYLGLTNTEGRLDLSSPFGFSPTLLLELPRRTIY